MEKKLKIAMLGHKRVPSREGGIEVVVEELSTRMVEMGHKVTCYNRTGHHISGKEYDGDILREYKGINLKYVLTINKRGWAAMTSSITGTICAAFGKYDVVHFHAEGPAFMCWLPKIFGKKIIVTVHGLDHQRAKWGKLASNFIMMGERNAVRFADEIIVLSESVKQYFRNTYSRESSFIPNGVSRPEIKTDELIKDKFELEKNNYLLFLGRLVPEKGLLYLIQAFKKVKTNKKLVIAGGSSDSDIFSRKIKELAKDDERILFSGFVQGDLLSGLSSNSYIYVLPSDLEGMPLTLLESMSYGNCCVVSDIPENASVVGDFGITFEKSNVEKLRECLQMLCDNPKIVKKYKERASEFICGKYSWNDTVNETLKLYQK